MNIVNELREQACRCLTSNVSDLRGALTRAADIIEEVEKLRDKYTKDSHVWFPRAFAAHDLNDALGDKEEVTFSHIELEFTSGVGRQMWKFDGYGMAAAVSETIQKYNGATECVLYRVENVKVPMSVRMCKEYVFVPDTFTRRVRI